MQHKNGYEETLSRELSQPVIPKLAKLKKKNKTKVNNGDCVGKSFPDGDLSGFSTMTLNRIIAIWSICS